MELYDYEIIDEFSNYFLLSFCSVFNKLASGVKLSRKEFVKELRKESGDKNGVFFPPDFFDTLFNELGYVVNDSDRDSLSTDDSRPVPFVLSYVERVYLKSILKSKYGCIFFNRDRLDELLEMLDDVDDIPFDDIFIFPGRHYGDTLNENFIKKLRTLMEAVLSRKEIIYNNIASNGRKYVGAMGYPVRIEYSVSDDRFRLSLWSTTEKRPVKVNIYSMYDIRLSGKSWSEIEAPQDIMKKHLLSEPVIIEVKDHNNSIERLNYALSVYDTETENTDDNTRIFRVRYYRFDREVLIRDILSFGPSVKVLSPPDIVEDVIKRIKGSTI